MDVGLLFGFFFTDSVRSYTNGVQEMNVATFCKFTFISVSQKKYTQVHGLFVIQIIIKAWISKCKYI